MKLQSNEKNNINKTFVELNIELYKKLYLIRSSELAIQKYYHEDDMKTPMHMSMGAEAISVGVCHAIGDSGQVFATYRSHAAFLAKTQDVDYFFAEMYAKETSLLKGKGGSMHLCHPDHNFMGTSAIVASNISVAVGASFANKYKYENYENCDKYNPINSTIVVVFFGDGAVDEGTFWESLNLACLKKLPIIFVCEDNGLAVHTIIPTRRGYKSITDIVEKFNCETFDIDSTDVLSIYKYTKKAIDNINEKQCPVFMNIKYYRYLEHVGINEDFDAGYRSKEEFKNYIEIRKDPIELQKLRLLKIGINSLTIKDIENEIDNKIHKSVTNAKNAPLSNLSETYNHVFY